MSWPISYQLARWLRFLSNVYEGLEKRVLKIGVVKCSVYSLLFGVVFAMLNLPPSIPLCIVFSFMFLNMAHDLVVRPEAFKVFDFQLPAEAEVKKTMKVMIVASASMLGWTATAIIRNLWAVQGAGA